MFKKILADSRFWLVTVISVAVVVTARFLLPIDIGFRWLVDYGYWSVLVLAVMFCRSIWAVIRVRCKAAEMTRFDAWVAIGVVGVSSIWWAHERPGYKILADELLLSGTAMGMHYDRKAATPTRATDVRATFEILERSLDKRPLAYPFLVATVHDLTGYRPENAFYVNMVLGGVFLWVVYLLGWRAGGSRWAGVVAGSLFAGLPLLAQQATGGGFELLNLLLLALLILFSVYYLELPQAWRLEALVFTALLLASTRYESVAVLVPLALAVVLGWWRSGRVQLTWPIMLSPVFLAPVFLQNRMFSSNDAAWQLQGKSGAEEAFGLHYVADNLGHALAFFFDFTGYHPNSVIFAIMGLVCLPFLALRIIRSVRSPITTSGAEIGWCLGGLTLLGLTAIYMLYFWGQFDDPIISRLSLPTHLLMVLGVVLTGALVFKTARGWQALAVIVVAGWWIQGLPVLARQAYRTNYSPGVEMQMRSSFLSSLKDRNVLFIDNDSFFWILHKIPASPVGKAVLQKEGVAFHMRNRSFQEVYVFQSILVDAETGESRVDPADDPGPDFELETVMERRVQTLLFARVSRVTAIKIDGEVVVRPSSFVIEGDVIRDDADIQRAQSLYMERWFRELP